MATAQLSQAEFGALSIIAKTRKQNTREMFTGTKLVFGITAKRTVAYKVAKSGKKIKSNIKKLKTDSAATKAVSNSQIRQTVKEFIIVSADVENINEISEVITEGALQELIAEVTPVFGVFFSAGKAAQAWRAVVKDTQNLYRHSDYRTGALSGDPLAAADAVKVIIKRELTKHTANAARQTTAAGVKFAGLFADLGTATNAGIGLGNTLAGLVIELYSLGLDIKDMRAGNKHLQTPENISLKVFEDCPLLGCYLLACSDTSNVANFFVADIGLPGWMDKVEMLKKTKLDPLITISNKAITSSYLHLDGLRCDKGIHKKASTLGKLKKNIKTNFGRFVRARV